MSFHVKPLSEIKRILFNETIHLLKHHKLIDKEYSQKLDKPDADLFAAIKKLDKPRDTQVEFLWKLLDVLDASQGLGFSKEKLDDNKRAKCFTGIAFAVLDEIYKSYAIRDPNSSRLYNGLQRVVGLMPENENDKDEVHELDDASKLSMVGYAHKFLMPYVYEDPSLMFVCEETPFSSIKKLDLHELYNTVVAINYGTSLEAHAEAQKNTEARIEQKVQQAKEKAKAEQQHSKSYFGRMFSAAAPENTTNAVSQKKVEETVSNTLN